VIIHILTVSKDNAVYYDAVGYLVSAKAFATAIKFMRRSIIYYCAVGAFQAVLCGIVFVGGEAMLMIQSAAYALAVGVAVLLVDYHVAKSAFAIVKVDIYIKAFQLVRVLKVSAGACAVGKGVILVYIEPALVTVYFVIVGKDLYLACAMLVQEISANAFALLRKCVFLIALQHTDVAEEEMLVAIIDVFSSYAIVHGVTAFAYAVVIEFVL
jgi:hypothetical protein